MGDAKNLPDALDTFCTVVIDGVQRARTPTSYKTDAPSFAQEYGMDLDGYAEELVIHLKSQKSSKSSDTIASIVKKIHTIGNQTQDEWYPLIAPDGKNVGSIRMRIQYTEVTVLPDQSYDDLFFTLVKDKMQITKMFASVASKDAKLVADSFVKGFEMRKIATHFVKEIISAEIESTPDVNIIFRGNSVATKALDSYMRLVGLPYMAKIIKPIVSEIYLGKKSCEMDAPHRCKEASVPAHAQNLKNYVRRLLEAISTSFKFCPASFRNIFTHIQQTVREKFGDDGVSIYTAPSGFIFLRFFCPAILNPFLFDLAKEHPSEKVNRDFTLIAKTLQNIANLVTFGKKEPYMECLNPFIEENMPLFKQFIDELCSPPTQPIDEIPSKTVINFGREMARIHAHVIDYLPEMRTKFGEDNELVLELSRVIDELNEELNGNGKSTELQPSIQYQTQLYVNQPQVVGGVAPKRTVVSPNRSPTLSPRRMEQPSDQPQSQLQSLQSPPSPENPVQEVLEQEAPKKKRLSRSELQFQPLVVPDSRKHWQ